MKKIVKIAFVFIFFFFSSRRRHTRSLCDWSSGVLFRSVPDRRVVPAESERVGQARRPGERPGPAGHDVEFHLRVEVGEVLGGGDDPVTQRADRSEERRVGKGGGAEWGREDGRKRMAPDG